MREAIRAGEASCLVVGHAFREENVFSKSMSPAASPHLSGGVKHVLISDESLSAGFQFQFAAPCAANSENVFRASRGARPPTSFDAELVKIQPAMGGSHESVEHFEGLCIQPGGDRPRRRRSSVRRRSCHVGAQRRQQGHGRQAGRDVEREESRPQDQPDLHPARRDGGQARPGDRLRRRARPDGHGPDLRPAVREGRPARRHHRPDRRTGRN